MIQETSVSVGLLLQHLQGLQWVIECQLGVGFEATLL